VHSGRTVCSLHIVKAFTLTPPGARSAWGTAAGSSMWQLKHSWPWRGSTDSIFDTPEYKPWHEPQHSLCCPTP